ncbi:MAG: toxin-antitoxin system HicB family antitoxin [Deltaproteobacteria bacterium]|nr:toxin-antitoxin system HicB family antitoxin [Deltaproteobacteria bacterium]
MTHGATPEEAIKNAKEAIEGYVESLKTRKLPVPEPLAEKKFSGNIPLRIDPVLHRDLATRAAIEGTSLNKLIEKRLKRAV